MKRKIIAAFLALITACVIAVSLGVLSRLFARGTATVNIPGGANSSQISQILKENKVIKSRAYFLARLYFSPYRGKLRYGTFKIERNSLLNEVFKTLSKDGAQKEIVRVTIPEGYSAEMIGDKLKELGLCTESEFDEALKKEYDYAFLKGIPYSGDIKYRLQGFLFPETYEFFIDAEAEHIIDTMLAQFEKKTASLNLKKEDIFEIVTKASMIEREAKIDEERAVIAGVIENRLLKGMRLQIDATAAYAATNGRYNKDRTAYSDLKVNSKYNTYRFDGLPPGPICNPSIKSIIAAASPQKHKYIYYHTDTEKNDGSHIFTQTFTEHKATKK